jgi:hypothetical protein
MITDRRIVTLTGRCDFLTPSLAKSSGSISGFSFDQIEMAAISLKMNYGQILSFLNNACTYLDGIEHQNLSIDTEDRLRIKEYY